MFPKSKVDFSVLGSESGATTFYIPVPVRCTVKSVQAAPSVDPGDAETITVTKGSTAIGVLACGTDIAAGDTGIYTPDATTGQTIFEAGESVKLVISQLTAAAVFCGYVEFDEYARVKQ